MGQSLTVDSGTSPRESLPSGVNAHICQYPGGWVRAIGWTPEIRPGGCRKPPSGKHLTFPPPSPTSLIQMTPLPIFGGAYTDDHVHYRIATQEDAGTSRSLDLYTPAGPRLHQGAEALRRGFRHFCARPVQRGSDLRR